MYAQPSLTGSTSLTLAALLLVAAAAQPAQAKDESEQEAANACPVDVQMRVGSANTLSRFQSLSGCTAYIIPNTETKPSQPLPEGTAVVRIIGVKDKSSSARKGNAKVRTPKVSLIRPVYDREIRSVAANYKIDPLFLHALVDAESGYRPTARSRVGALGLMQIMPATGAGLGVNSTALLNPSTNLDAGARHLKQLQKRYGQNFDLIFSAYNAGAGAVERYGRKIPPFAETQAYVVKVMNRYTNLRAGLSGLSLGARR